MHSTFASVWAFVPLVNSLVVPGLPVSLAVPSVALPTVTVPAVSLPVVVPTNLVAIASSLSTALPSLDLPSVSVSLPSSLPSLLSPFVPNRKTDAESIALGRAYAKTSSPTSNVKGLKFDRFVNIWLENTDFESAIADDNFAWIAKQGILLNNYYGVAHPSQPNYAAVVGGSQNRITSGQFSVIPQRVETIVDRLEEAGISWGEYQEGLPYSGFLGDFKNPINGRNDYVRKHNPLVTYKSVTESLDRLSQIKNFTMFEQDLKDEKLPQWMFITPNMTNDGHDSSVTIAGAWSRKFLEPLLTDNRFMQNTIVLLTFDESERYDNANRVYSVLLGDAIPSNLHGVTDTTKYNHFSNLVTVQKNWGLAPVLPNGVGEKTANAFYPFNKDGSVIMDHNSVDAVPDMGEDIADIVGDALGA